MEYLNLKDRIVIPNEVKLEAQVKGEIEEFFKHFSTLELDLGIPLILLRDNLCNAFYIVCHLDGKKIVSAADLDAVLDPMESEDYKLNRDLYLDTYAYQKMEYDAMRGRSFEDLVIEYDTQYRPHLPLKVFGGQHRIRAISIAVKKGVSAFHGVRIYFGLDRNQKVDIAIANNTAITISNDLLDRMSEQHLGPELRKWAQTVGIIGMDKDFADKRNPDGVPTVRIVRTLLTNYFKGQGSKKDTLHKPVVCSSGPSIDADYLAVRKSDWSDKSCKRMGQEFARLHKLQRERVLAREEDNFPEFANKATHPTVTAAWAYTAGFLETNFPSALPNHYALAEIEEGDPLNAKALSTARLIGIDPDTYRGIGTRINSTELGRMLEVFLLQAVKAKNRGITKKLANAAITSFEAKKRTEIAAKAVKGL
jgi:hypothetical protein